MKGFDLLENYLDDPEVLLRNIRAKLKKVLAVVLEDNQIRRSLTPEFEAMANKSDTTTPPCNILQPPSQATPTQVSPTSTQAQDFDGPITCSRAKNL
jgi:hypothetical protein